MSFCRAYFLVAVLLLAGCREKGLVPDIEKDEYAIYKVILERHFLEQWNQSKPEQVIIFHKTAGFGELSDPDRVRIQRRLTGLQKGTLRNFKQRNRQSTYLADQIDLNVKYKLVTSEDINKLFQGRPSEEGWKRFHEAFPGSRGMIVLSRVGFNGEKSQALVLLSYSGGMLAGSDTYILLVKRNNTWLIDEKSTVLDI